MGGGTGPCTPLSGGGMLGIDFMATLSVVPGEGWRGCLPRCRRYRTHTTTARRRRRTRRRPATTPSSTSMGRVVGVVGSVEVGRV